MDGIWRHFRAASTSLELTPKLKNSCTALEAWLGELSAEEVRNQTCDSIDLIKDALALLPNDHESAQDLIKQCDPCADDIDRLDRRVSKMVGLATQSASKKAYERSLASERAIASIVQASGAYMERVSWFKSAVDETHALDLETRAHVQELVDGFHGRVMECQADIASGNSCIDKSKQLKGTHNLQICEIACKRRDQLIESGESPVSAELDAYTEVISSTDAKIVALRRAIEDHNEEVKRCQSSMVNSKAALRFYESMVDLLDCIRQQEEGNLKQMIDAQKMAELEATTALLAYIPTLTNGTLEYYQFHSVQQTMVHEVKQEQEKQLAMHEEYLGQTAPLVRGDIEKRIRECVGAIAKSTQTMMQIADAQCRLWKGKRALLPFSVWTVLIEEYGKLWQELSGPVRQIMQQFVDGMETEQNAAFQDDVTAEAAPIPLLIEFTSDPEQRVDGWQPLAPKIDTYDSPVTRQRVMATDNNRSDFAEKLDADLEATAANEQLVVPKTLERNRSSDNWVAKVGVNETEYGMCSLSDTSMRLVSGGFSFPDDQTDEQQWKASGSSTTDVGEASSADTKSSNVSREGCEVM